MLQILEKRRVTCLIWPWANSGTRILIRGVFPCIVRDLSSLKNWLIFFLVLCDWNCHEFLLTRQLYPKWICVYDWYYPIWYMANIFALWLNFFPLVCELSNFKWIYNMPLNQSSVIIRPPDFRNVKWTHVCLGREICCMCGPLILAGWEITEYSIWILLICAICPDRFYDCHVAIYECSVIFAMIMEHSCSRIKIVKVY